MNKDRIMAQQNQIAEPETNVNRPADTMADNIEETVVDQMVREGAEDNMTKLTSAKRLPSTDDIHDESGLQQKTPVLPFGERLAEAMQQDELSPKIIENRPALKAAAIAKEIGLHNASDALVGSDDHAVLQLQREVRSLFVGQLNERLEKGLERFYDALLEAKAEASRGTTVADKSPDQFDQISETVEAVLASSQRVEEESPILNKVVETDNEQEKDELIAAIRNPKETMSPADQEAFKDEEIVEVVSTDLMVGDHEAATTPEIVFKKSEIIKQLDEEE